VTLYVAKSQAQRVADAGALAGAKTLVELGITADPLDTQGRETATCIQATAQASTIANRGRIGGVAPLTVTPQFCTGGACGAGCPAPGAVGTGFGVNPQVQVGGTERGFAAFLCKDLGDRDGDGACDRLRGRVQSFEYHGSGGREVRRSVVVAEPRSGDWCVDFQ